MGCQQPLDHHLKIVSVWISVYVFVCVCVCVCVSTLRLLITSGVIWTPYDWLNKFYSCYMATVVIIVNGHCGIRDQITMIKTDTMNTIYHAGYNVLINVAINVHVWNNQCQLLHSSP